MNGDQELIGKVKSEFADYLEQHDYRKTSERFAVLEQIYSSNKHFDITSLYHSMVKRNFRVSKATLYNTMDLLLDCGLVIKHQFGNSRAFYERKYGNENHHHLICTLCGNITEVKNRLTLTPKQLKRYSKFEISYYDIYVYGVCTRCQRKSGQKHKK